MTTQYVLPKINKHWRQRLPCRALHHRLAVVAMMALIALNAAITPCGREAWAEEVKEPTKLSIVVQADIGVNPDVSGRASPIKVRIYELKDSAAFAEADYFSLDASDKTILAADMLNKDEFLLRPGEKRRIERKSNSNTTAIGILAGYRDMANVTWRTTLKLKEAPESAWYRVLLPANKFAVQIQLQAQGIVVDTP